MSVQLPSSDSRRNQYFIPGEGIARQVITADICKYLDNDALVRPGEYQGIAGFFIFAYRNLTKVREQDRVYHGSSADPDFKEMIEDLKAASKRFDIEKRKYSSGHQGGGRHQAELSYTNSRTFAANGPSQGGTSPHLSHPHSAAPRVVPAGDYGRQQPSPYNEPPYPTQPPHDDYPPTSRAPGYPSQAYPPSSSGFQQPRSSFPPSSSGSYTASDDSGVNTFNPGGYAGQAPPHMSQMPPQREYSHAPSSGVPMPGYPDSRNDMRGPPQRNDTRSGYGEKRPADPYPYGDQSRPYGDSRRRY